MRCQYPPGKFLKIENFQGDLPEFLLLFFSAGWILKLRVCQYTDTLIKSPLHCFQWLFFQCRGRGSNESYNEDIYVYLHISVVSAGLVKITCNMSAKFYPGLFQSTGIWFQLFRRRIRIQLHGVSVLIRRCFQRASHVFIHTPLLPYREF